MKLFYVPGACSMACHITLNEMEIPFELEKVDPKNKVVSEGDYLKSINPKGSVPALKMDNGEVLTEGAVIMQYIADQKPEKNLIPKFGTLERYRAMEMLNFIATDIHKGFGQLWNPKAPAEIHEQIKATMGNRFDLLNARLKKYSFLLGAQFTVADAYLFTTLGWTKRMNFDMSKWPELMSYCEKIQSRPAVQKTMKTEGLI